MYIPSTSTPGVGGGVTILSRMVISTLSLDTWSPPGPEGKLSLLVRTTLKVSPPSERPSSMAVNGTQRGLVEVPSSDRDWGAVGEKSSAEE